MVEWFEFLRGTRGVGPGSHIADRSWMTSQRKTASRPSNELATKSKAVTGIDRVGSSDLELGLGLELTDKWP